MSTQKQGWELKSSDMSQSQKHASFADTCTHLSDMHGLKTEVIVSALDSALSLHTCNLLSVCVWLCLLTFFSVKNLMGPIVQTG